MVTFGNRPGSQWAGQIERMDGTAAVLMVTPAPDAIVGKYRTYVAIATGGGMQRTSRDTSTDLYLLFNAWCPGTDDMSAGIFSQRKILCHFYYSCCLLNVA